MNRFLQLNRILLFVSIFSTAMITYAHAADSYYYELKVYHLKNQAQEDRLEKYLQNALVPALHRLGVKEAGVFKPVASDTLGKRMYVFIPFHNLSDIEGMEQKLSADREYLDDGKDYVNAVYNDAPYTRIETIILKAFPKMTAPVVPQLTAKKADRIYEFRSYESPTEVYNINKVKMFNDGDEVALFKRLGFNAVFYSEVIIGSNMPNLMYMITFDNMQQHDKLWKNFSDDPYWKSLSAKPEYQNNVNHIDAIFLHPTDYSDF